WNTAPTDVADRGDDRSWEVFVGTKKQSPSPKELSVPPAPEPVKPAPPEPKPRVVKRQPIVVEPPKPIVEIKPPAPKVHIIRAGETLESIALHYYKTRKGIQWIVTANKLKNPDRVYENQKLVIPARKVIKPKTNADATPKTQPRPATSSNQIPADGRYRVKAGDGDLYAICRRFYGSKGEGARVARIMELNHLWSADVKTGTILILPKK
ncbi:MAG: LysM peptidoglycan-binding domain-containing protein, partial [Planctomycetota bacterium]